MDPKNELNLTNNAVEKISQVKSSSRIKFKIKRFSLPLRGIVSYGGSPLFAYKIISSFGEKPVIVSRIGKVIPKELENIEKQSRCPKSKSLNASNKMLIVIRHFRTEKS